MSEQALNVVRYGEENRPVYEMNAEEISFPLQLDQGGQSVIAYFNMDAQYMSHEVKAFLDDIMTRVKAGEFNGEQEWADGDDRACQSFISKHFRSITGVEGEVTHEDMKAWVEDNPGVKARIFREGYDRIALDVDDTAPVKGLSLIRPVECSVKTRYVLYSPERNKLEEVRVKHVTRKETEEDRIRHKRAQKLTQKGRYSQLRTNWDTIEQIYNSMILRLEGAYIDGEPCTEQNRDKWLPKVPFLAKTFVISRIFSRLAVKNG